MTHRPSGTAGAAVPRQARGCADDWTRLATSDPSTGVFEPGLVSELPEAAARWLCAAVAPGTPLARAVLLQMCGEIKLGGWRPFAASQVIRPAAGLIWAATVRLPAISISGFDRYSSGSGQMRWRVLGIPVMSAAGPDIDRSAAGRLAAESMLVPTAFDQATWAPGPDADTALATWHIDAHVETVQVRVAADGALREISMSRWGDPGGESHGRYPFGVIVEDEVAFSGIRVPTAVRAFWGWGTPGQAEGEFFRARINSVIALG